MSGERSASGGFPRPSPGPAADGGFLHLAGVLARGEGQPAATILTTTPNADIADLHNRMPVVLNDDDAATWVLEDLSLEQLDGFLQPCPNGWPRLAPASRGGQ